MTADRRRVLLATGALLVLAVAVYFPTLDHEFVWDDIEQVVNNELLRDWGNVTEFWHKDILELSREEAVHSNYYRPLFYTQYLIYYQLVGLNEVAWHALAILQHFLAAAAALFCLRRLGFGFEVAFISSLLFVVHPAHGESVSWVAAAFNDPPAAMFILLGLAAQAIWIQRGSARHAILGALAYAAALSLKESGLSVLLLVPLVDGLLSKDRSWFKVALDYVPFATLLLFHIGIERKIDSVIPGLATAGGFWAGLARHPHVTFAVPLIVSLGLLAWYHRRRSRMLVGFTPYFVVTLLYFYVRRLSIVFVFGYQNPDGQPIADLAPTFPLIGAYYMKLLLWPFGMSPSYPVRYVEGWLDPQAWVWLIGLLLVAGLVGYGTRHCRELQFSTLWILCCIWPVFNLTSFLKTYLVHQRYLYLACLGVCLGLGFLLVMKVSHKRLRFALTGTVLVLWASSNFMYNDAWASDLKLWTRIAQVDPGNPEAFNFLALKARNEGRYEDSAQLCRRAIEADPGSPNARSNLAVLLHTKLGRVGEAIPYYEQALGVYQEQRRSGKLASPRALEYYARFRLNYASGLVEVGREAEALKLMLDVLETEPYPARAAEGAAVLYRARGDIPSVVEILERGLERHPAHAGLLGKLIEVHRAAGRPRAAEPYIEQLREVRPDDPLLRNGPR